MFKEIIISIIIVICIVCLDFVTRNYTNESISQTTLMLVNLKETINNGEHNISNKINEIISTWNYRKDKLAYFIEHDELEKVDTTLTNLKSYIEVSDFDMAIYGIDETKYILEHIKQKNSFSLINVF